MDFKFNIENEIFKVISNYKVGGLLISSLKKSPDPKSSLDMIVKNVVEIITKRKDYLANSKTYLAWEKIFNSLGLKGDDYMPSHIALSKRVIKKSQLIRINTIVDLYNIISLYRLIPLGGHDIGNIESITVGKTAGGEKFKPMVEGENEVLVPVGEFAYLDKANNRVLTRNLVWRQAEYSKVTDSTINLFIPIDDVTGQMSDQSMQQLAGQIVGLFKLFYDFDYNFGIATKYNPNINYSEINTDVSVSKPGFLLAQSQIILDNQQIDKFFDRKLAEIFPSKDKLLGALKSGRRLRFYMGADCTAPRLHIGHMIPFMKMAELQKLGHQIVFLIGDFTGRIGDPTDKTSARIQLTEEDVIRNSKEYVKQISKIIDFEDPQNPAVLVFNSSWNEQLKFQDVIELSTNFTVQQMLERDMFEKRMKENKPIYIHEFMYPLMQGYDSVFMEIDGEFGGKDQTFNMLAGRHLLETMKSMDKFVITVPTLLSSDGVTKMSKSIGDCIFLTDTPADKFGKIMAIPDNLIIHYYELITKLSDQAINDIKTGLASGSILAMDAKKNLGYELVKMLDGEEQAQKAKDFFEHIIQNGEVPSGIKSTKRDLISKKYGEIINIKDLLVELGMSPSNSEAKRLIGAGAVEINNEKIIDLNKSLDITQLDIIKVGKRNWHKIID